jgi:hypothetical protein
LAKGGDFQSSIVNLQSSMSLFPITRSSDHPITR